MVLGIPEKIIVPKQNFCNPEIQIQQCGFRECFKLFRLYLQHPCIYIHVCWQVLGQFKNRKSLKKFQLFILIKSQARRRGSMNGSWLDRNRHVVFIGLLLTALVGAIVFYLRRPAQETVEILPVEPTATIIPTPLSSPTPAMVRVYVTGGVVNSDVYFLPQGSIIKDAILAAGGFTQDADPERINQALELKDQQQIHVPKQDEENPPPPVQDGPANDSNKGDSSPAPATDERININTATLDQLDTLPGIGPAIAQRIIDYREKIGGFKNIEQITEVSGIGQATFVKIKELITVD
jgi:competence protein ComEA